MQNESPITKADLVKFKEELVQEFPVLTAKKSSTLDLLKTADVQEILKCSESTVDRLKKSSKLPFIRIMRSIYFRREDVEALVAKEQMKGIEV